MKAVLLLSSCDAWLSYSSFRTIGVFSNFKKMVKYLKKYDNNLSEWDIEMLSTIEQTQCRNENYCIEKLNVNPKLIVK